MNKPNQIKSSIFQTNRLSFSSTFCAAVGLLMADRTTLIWRRIDVIVGSPSKKSRRTWNICGFLENCWWQAWFSHIQHEQSSFQHYEFNQKTSILKCKFVIGTGNEHTALKWLGGDFSDRKKGWRCSLDRISKVYRYRHHKTKLKNEISSLFRWFLSSKKLKSMSYGGYNRKSFTSISRVILWSHSVVARALLTHKKVAIVIVWMTFWVGMNMGFLQTHGIYFKHVNSTNINFKNPIFSV